MAAGMRISGSSQSGATHHHVHALFLSTLTRSPRAVRTPGNTSMLGEAQAGNVKGVVSSTTPRRPGAGAGRAAGRSFP